MGSTRILVTGGSGFVGRSIVAALVRDHPEWKVTVLDIRKAPNLPEGVEYFEANVRNAAEVHNALEWVEPEVVVHSAGIVPQMPQRYDQKHKQDVWDLNVHGTENVIEACLESGVKALVLTSTSQVIADDLDHDYPNFDEGIPYPHTALPYGESKAEAERLVLKANGAQLLTCALRPSVIPGRDDYQLIPSIHACIAKGETPFQIGSGDNLYDFTFVDNVADSHVLAVENLLGSKTAAGKAILISNDQPITFRDFCLAVWAQFDHVPPYTIQIPVSVAWFLGLIAETISGLMGTRSTLSSQSVKDAIGTRYANISRAKELLGYEARVPLWEGIRISCEAYKARLSKEDSRNK